MKLKELKRKNIKETLAWLLATWWGSGCSPKAPGTVGSFCSLPIVLIGIFWGTEALLFVSVLLFLMGWWATGEVLKSQGAKDPGFVVIDETVGQTLTFVLVLQMGWSWYVPTLGFILFRFFDIVKLWPASYFDKSVHNAFGVMMDDVIAGGYAAVVLYGLTFFI